MNDSKQQIVLPHNVAIEDRCRATISGVSAVGTFDDETVVLLTEMGELTIKGQNLHISKFNVETGEFAVDGTISALFYSAERAKGGFFSRVFK